tara:strand:+ start:477 stop:932 length:456 start_codon:yes stop_codon:yes gene_type:complete
MKLLLENWRKYLKEEPKELEEGFATKLALGAALAGAAGPAYAGDTDTSSDVETTQQVDVEKPASELVKNKDGSVSLTIDIPDMYQSSMPSMKNMLVKNYVRAELTKQLSGPPGVDCSGGKCVHTGVPDVTLSKVSYSIQPDTVTITATVAK